MAEGMDSTAWGWGGGRALNSHLPLVTVPTVQKAWLVMLGCMYLC